MNGTVPSEASIYKHYAPLYSIYDRLLCWKCWVYFVTSKALKSKSSSFYHYIFEFLVIFCNDTFPLGCWGRSAAFNGYIKKSTSLMF